jgi:hypothetical protein
MTRALLLVAAAMFAHHAERDRLGPIQATSVIGSTAEMSDREDCLSREVARLLEPTEALPQACIILRSPPLFLWRRRKTRSKGFNSGPPMPRISREMIKSGRNNERCHWFELREKRVAGGE